jgi:plastocyanin
MSRRFIVAIAAIAVLGVSASAVAQGTPKVRIVGKTVFKPGKFVKDTQRFKARVITVTSGQQFSWVNQAKAQDPHTISLVNKLPKSFDCEECGAYEAKHAVDDNGEPANPVVDEGAQGFDTPGGDSVAIPPGGKGSGKILVSAPAGTTLKYLCLIHPWMQARIKVK